MSNNWSEQKEDRLRKLEEEHRRHKEKKSHNPFKRKHKHKRDQDMSASYGSCSDTYSESEDEFGQQGELYDSNAVEFTTEQLAREAPIEYKRAEFVLDDFFTPRSLIEYDKNKKPVGVKNDGKRIFTVGNGFDMGTRTNGEDFKPLDSRRHRNKDGRYSKVQAPRNRDIVKKIVWEKARTNWTGRILASVSVPAFSSEAFYDDSPNVNCNILPGELSATEPRDIVLLERSIKLSAIDFQNSFPGITPDNFDDAIQPGSKTHMMVDFDSPTVLYYNGSVKGQQSPLTLDHIVPNTNSVLMPRADVKKYAEIARDAMRKAISYADVRNNFTLTLSVPLSNRQRQHRRERGDDEDGDDRRRRDNENERRRNNERRERDENRENRERRERERDFMANFNFADVNATDPYNINGELRGQALEEALDKKYFFAGRIMVYYHGTDSPMEIMLNADGSF